MIMNLVHPTTSHLSESTSSPALPGHLFRFAFYCTHFISYVPTSHVFQTCKPNHTTPISRSVNVVTPCYSSYSYLLEFKAPSLNSFYFLENLARVCSGRTYNFNNKATATPPARTRAMPKGAKFPDISDKVQRLLGADMDQVANRRRAREAFKDVQLSIDHCLFKMPYEELKTEESYEVNSRGFEIFSKSWLPKKSPPKAVICFCHGYGDTCSFFFEGIARKLASSGYGVFAMDYVGFGLSEGLHGFIPSFEKLVDDVIEQYTKVKENPEFSALPHFLFGQSMGGAIALKVHLKQPDAWSGAILIAPMCKIADDMLPSKFVTRVLISVAKVLPKKKIVPQKDLAELAFRDLRKKDLTAYNIICYNDKPRVGTALELLLTTQQLENQLQEVSLPLLILHGKADRVTDPLVSKVLYEKASSSDKKLNLYDDAYHCLLEGEPDENIFSIFEDIISWLDEHSKITAAQK